MTDAPNPAPTGKADAHETDGKADAAQDHPQQGGTDEKARIEALEAEIETLRDSTMRARAEVENVLRRTAKEKQDASAYAISGFARDLLAVSDNLRRTLDALPASAREDGTLKVFVDGVELTERELLSSFERHGIKRIDPKGEKFDHNFHQAMAEVETDAQAPGTVVDVYQAGYVIRDRLLRPAMVTVAKAGTPKAAQGVDTTA
ncbi:nucleotide exchange factor GrpE [Iodidimonas muriae]